MRVAFYLSANRIFNRYLKEEFDVEWNSSMGISTGHGRHRLSDGSIARLEISDTSGTQYLDV